MQAVTTIGLDIAKSVFQVHRVDITGQVVIRRQLTGIEGEADTTLLILLRTSICQSVR